MQNKTGKCVSGVALAILIALLPASPSQALPPDPDNAALLYYQAFLTVAELDDEARTVISDVAKGRVDPNDKVREYLGQCRGAIGFAEAAAEVPTCHWGFRFSQRWDVLMPQLSQVRSLAFILTSDARVRASDGNYRGALERCLMTNTLARHVGDDTLISYLVSIAVRNLGYECMRDILGQASGDVDCLRWLKRELATTSEREVTLIRPLKIECEISLDTLRMENAAEYARAITQGDEQKEREILAGASEELFDQARKIYGDCITEGLTILAGSMPYAQAHARLNELSDALDPNDPAAGAARALMPSLARMLTLRLKTQAQSNAMKAAVEICLRKAETGKLPTALPSGLPKDPFSGDDFEYERTDDSFVLRCKGKDLDKDIQYEYAFKLK